MKREYEEEKWKEGLSASEAKSLEEETELSEDVDEEFHTDDEKQTKTAGDDWMYIDDGFDAELEQYEKAGKKPNDKLTDIQNALSTWRTALTNNNVLDDMLTESQDVPTATAYGNLIKLIDDYDNDSSAWTLESKGVKASLMKLKSVATRLNETMMKAAAETYSDIDEKVTYKDLTDIAEDPVGYRAKKPLRSEKKRVFERLNSYDDEIRGEESPDKVVSDFLPSGQGDSFVNEEKSHAKGFIKDYNRKTEEKRRTHLNVLTQKMFDIAISVEMLTPEYMAEHMEKMEYFRTQLAYFEDVRNDPMNAQFFKRFPEKAQKKLDIIDKVSTSFTPGDFVRNVNDVNKREKWYRPDSKDQKRLDDILREHSESEVMDDFIYDTKSAIKELKNSRL